MLRQSPASAKRQAAKLCSIVSLDCIENLNSKFDGADSNSNRRNVGFGEFIEHMRADPSYSGYFASESYNNDAEQMESANGSIGDAGRRGFQSRLVSRLAHLLN